jgi:hypothetical protein
MSGTAATRRRVPACQVARAPDEPDQAIFCIRSIHAIRGSVALRLLGKAGGPNKSGLKN